MRAKDAGGNSLKTADWRHIAGEPDNNRGGDIENSHNQPCHPNGAKRCRFCVHPASLLGENAVARQTISIRLFVPSWLHQSEFSPRSRSVTDTTARSTRSTTSSFGTGSRLSTWVIIGRSATLPARLPGSQRGQCRRPAD